MTSSAEVVDQLARQLAADSIRSTTAAGSGHPTSAMSSAHLVATLLMRHFRFRVDDPDDPANDRLVLSKGHAAPVLYAALAAMDLVDAGRLHELRSPESELEGHPVPRLPLIDVATGSLGQGLPNGLGMALGLRRLGSPGRVWVILGDSEMSEGSVWEAMALAHHHRVDRLRAIVDVNRLGQTGPTMHGWDVDRYLYKANAFGWNAAEAEGHHPDDISRAIELLDAGDGTPGMVVARTVKGNGVSFLADREDMHGKALDPEEAERAIAELDPPPRMSIQVAAPERAARRESLVVRELSTGAGSLPSYEQPVATRQAFGDALAAEAGSDSNLVVLDAEVSNSTMTDAVAKEHGDQFLQMYVSEQTMVGAAVGLQAVGLRPVVSTFAAFLTRAHDFIRMAAIGRATMVVNGSHAGVSIGEDGPSQMGLDDLAMMRAIPETTVLYPADGNSTAALTRAALRLDGITYIRTTREATNPIYEAGQSYAIGGSRTLRSSDSDTATVVGAGVTVHQALSAADELARSDIDIRVIDAYSVQPIDHETMQRALDETGWIIVVEDHSPVGGLGDAVLDAVAETPGGRVTKLAVSGVPSSAPPDTQRDLAGISARAIVDEIRTSIMAGHDERAAGSY